MTKKTYLYLSLVVLAFTFIGVGAASAHGWFGGFRSATPQEAADMHTNMFAHHADILGVSEDTVKDAWAKGTSLPELADELGISEEDLAARMKEAHKARMQEEMQALVDQGVITQEQADARIKFMNEHMENFSGMMGHMGQKGLGKHGAHGMMW